jgi:addiction module HigA family antidote
MSIKKTTEYNPPKVSHPGVTLRETLQSLGMTQAELSNRMGRPLKTINEIVKGKTAITSETALQLETVLGIPASFWLKRQQQFDESLARIQQINQHQHYIEWASKFPINEMCTNFNFKKHKDRIDQVKELLTFFGITSPDQWHHYWSCLTVQYRQSNAFPAQAEAISAWLRMGEIQAQKVKCEKFSESAFREALLEIRTLTTKPIEHFESRTRNLCAKSGVAYALVPELPKTRVSGATMWLTDKKVLLQQNLRYKTNDQFWFTFFHEAGHILLHSDKELILEYQGNQDSRESEANDFSSNLLIPRKQYNKFIESGDISTNSVERFAKSIDIAPGIVVGRLQHDGHIEFGHLNSLKMRFEWEIE